MKLIPKFARVLMQREHLKSAKILIPDAAAQRNAPCKGRVIAKGPTADESIEIGKSYIFGPHSGMWLRSDGGVASIMDDSTECFFVCQDEDIICEIVEDEKSLIVPIKAGIITTKNRAQHRRAMKLQA